MTSSTSVKGGTALPADLQRPGCRVSNAKNFFYDVHFAHAGPLPGMQYFDDFFYHDPDTKKWWYNKPEIFAHTGHRFGVYGHTVMEEGIYLDKDHHFAMIDALSHRQFFEMLLDDERLDYRIMQF